MASPRLPKILLFSMRLPYESLMMLTPSSLSRITLLRIVFPFRPSSASLSSTPAIACCWMVRFSTTLKVVPPSRTPYPNSLTMAPGFELVMSTFVWPAFRMPAGKPSSWPVMLPRR